MDFQCNIVSQYKGRCEWAVHTQSTTNNNECPTDNTGIHFSASIVYNIGVVFSLVRLRNVPLACHESFTHSSIKILPSNLSQNVCFLGIYRVNIVYIVNTVNIVNIDNFNIEE